MYNRLGITWVPMHGVHVTDDFGNLVMVPVFMFGYLDNYLSQ